MGVALGEGVMALQQARDLLANLPERMGFEQGAVIGDRVIKTKPQSARGAKSGHISSTSSILAGARVNRGGKMEVGGW